jgi:hypothetical protein
MSMLMDACLKMEQIGTLFVWVGALEGGFGGGGAHRGGPPPPPPPPSGVSTPKSIRVVPKINTLLADNRKSFGTIRADLRK